MYGFGEDGFYIKKNDPHVPVPADPEPSGQPPLRYYEPPFCDAPTASGFGVNQITDFPMAYSNGEGKRDGRGHRARRTGRSPLRLVAGPRHRAQRSSQLEPAGRFRHSSYRNHGLGRGDPGRSPPAGV
jgi:hypothetical protein